MTSMDFNIENYTIPELLTILDIDDEPDETQIIYKTNNYIDNPTSTPQMSHFFQQMQDTLLTYIEDLAGDTPDNDINEQTQRWMQYTNLPQKNTQQRDKNTDRIQKIDVYDNQHVPMNREQLGINNTKTVPVAQDTLNPNLKNTTTRIINLDSQYRQASGGIDTQSTNYTLDLSDPLTDTLSLRLYSFHLPITWYVIDNHYGNTCFWVTNSGQDFKIYIEPGNYTSSTLCDAINNAFTNSANFPDSISGSGFTWNGAGTPPDIATFNINNGKITLNLSPTSSNPDDYWNDPDGIKVDGISNPNDADVDTVIEAYFTFFDFEGQLICGDTCSVKNMSFDGTLGWLMGYRSPILPVYIDGNNASAILNLFGTKYFILVLDDYNQNHINNGLVTITELSKNLPLPSYYNPVRDYVCTTPAQSNALKTVLFTSDITNLGDKLTMTHSDIPQILPSAPRTLTQAQIYTINEIIKNKTQNTSYRSKAPTTSDTFAIIPIKQSKLVTGDMYVDFSGSLQDNKRIYFGPVDIERMKIKLLDDRGYVVDLHGVDWCITLISENLYQY